MTKENEKIPDQTQESVLPDAWLYTCKKPGYVTVFASIDENDTQHWPLDQWTEVTKEPLSKKYHDEWNDFLIYKQAYFDHVNDRNHTAWGTRDYQTNPIKSFEHYLKIRLLAAGIEQ